ncbi:MAG: electron transfer flavoprotein subunit beta/FixA family protein [Candidatus Marinimicrobia bacterium]|jgi:electron transfer flavoprotein beta subunit|nr:electron transfer flavoprotein subunit beta/FixA family protein [Candidatus Neomarinimicrobiota bacterium]MBT3936573.1 electron transfer flavoprotein subunit beta/FixA family protein [Candidatus Neomarinimicrobiota bacterium]MBT3961754.1 electron transfer flavoprotein subunit beta/FixA family protein [Candidatus Neomarinimicrobiota bacterium]MBT4382785.1 electron transfer flavoprotein subunit beta/FixA family protein [Candidatus Neomarinimicrobiota bacterium]MBT4635279.1 electron transfer fl|tara:strand:+ start:148 stop:918 length:771 start_codon:yes stop_codon:yes gene_type:complete
MKIGVLIKQVPGAESALPINDNETGIQEDQASFLMNESDSYALEEAQKIIESRGNGEVVAISLGPDRVQKIIREALAKGADRGIHLQTDAKGLADPLTLAKQFAKALESEQFDLIFSGLQSDDSGMGQTGIILGELLNMSTASLVVGTELSENTLKVKRELEAGWSQWVTLTLPASISIQSGLNQPRYPSLKGIMGAKKKELKILSESEFYIDGKKQSIQKVFVPKTNKKTEMIEGEPDTIVARLVDVLKNEVKVL